MKFSCNWSLLFGLWEQFNLWNVKLFSASLFRLLLNWGGLPVILCCRQIPNCRILGFIWGWGSDLTPIPVIPPVFNFSCRPCVSTLAINLAPKPVFLSLCFTCIFNLILHLEQQILRTVWGISSVLNFLEAPRIPGQPDVNASIRLSWHLENIVFLTFI